jgi:hypothetical protein
VPITHGFDVVQRGEFSVFAVAQNGDLRLFWGAFASNTYHPILGPPRAVPLAPGDERFDLDVICEAAWPRVAFVEDALIVTWQERCAPEPRWRVAVRVIH